MPQVRSNLSAKAREVSKTGKAIFKDVGDTVAQAIWEEFVTLLYETPQWTGTTAASWDLTMRGRGSAQSGEVRTQPKRTRKEALEKGHEEAVAIAKAANRDSLAGIATQYRYTDIIVSNQAPGSERAEHGPLRPENDPGGALARFEERVSSKIFKPLKNRMI